MRQMTVATAILVAICSSALAQDAKVARGEKVYTEQKCALCHSIGGQGNTKGPLDKVGSKVSADEMRQWLDTNPTRARPRFLRDSLRCAHRVAACCSR